MYGEADCKHMCALMGKIFWLLVNIFFPLMWIETVYSPAAKSKFMVGPGIMVYSFFFGII